MDSSSDQLDTSGKEDNSSKVDRKNNMVSKKTATVIITGIVLFVLAFFGVGAFLLHSHIRQPVTNQGQELAEDEDNVNEYHNETDYLSQYEQYEPAEEEEPEEVIYNQIAVEEEHDVHPLIGTWRLVYTTDHVNAEMMEYGFVFYWQAYEDGTARSRMHSPHSGWHTIEEYAWSIPEDGILEEVITYVNIQAFEMYLLGPEHAEMAAEFVGVMMSSIFEIDQDTFTQTMPYLMLVYQRVED